MSQLLCDDKENLSYCIPYTFALGTPGGALRPSNAPKISADLLLKSSIFGLV